MSCIRLASAALLLALSLSAGPALHTPAAATSPAAAATAQGEAPAAPTTAGTDDMYWD